MALFGCAPWKWLYRSLAIAAKAKKFDVVISHQSHMSFYLALSMAVFGCKTRHFSYGFNHGDGRFLRGISRFLARRVFNRVEGFVVYSEHEKRTYAEYYKTGVHKYAFVHWGVKSNRRLDILPAFAVKMKPYFICMGRNNRDFRLAIDASIAAGVNLIVVCPAGAVSTSNLPASIIVLHNRSLEECTALLADSVGNIVPLKDDSRGAGHMTIVSAMKYGIPTIVTRVQSIDDYFFDGLHGYFVTQGSATDLTGAIRKIAAEIEDVNGFSLQCKQFADLWLSEDAAQKFLGDYLTSIEAGPPTVSAPKDWDEYKILINSR